MLALSVISSTPAPPHVLEPACAASGAACRFARHSNRPWSNRRAAAREARVKLQFLHIRSAFLCASLPRPPCPERCCDPEQPDSNVGGHPRRLERRGDCGSRAGGRPCGCSGRTWPVRSLITWTRLGGGLLCIPLHPFPEFLPLSIPITASSELSWWVGCWPPSEDDHPRRISGPESRSVISTEKSWLITRAFVVNPR